MARNNTTSQSPEILQARGAKSFEVILAFFGNLQRNPENAKAFLSQFVVDDNTITIPNIGQLANDPDSQGLSITFQAVLHVSVYGKSYQFYGHSEGTGEALFYVVVRKRDQIGLEDDLSFLNILSHKISDYFLRKRTYYWRDIFPPFIRHKLGRTKSGTMPKPLGKGTEDEKEYYNKPSVYNNMIKNVEDEINTRIRDFSNIEDVKDELSLNSSYGFIHKTYDKLVPDEYKKNLSYKNRLQLFKDLHDIYLSVEDELMKNKKVVKLSAQQLAEIIKREISSYVRETQEKGTPEWKDMTKHVKVDTKIQPPKEIDKGKKVAQKSLKDLMGSAGDEVLVKPVKHLPPDEKDTNKLTTDELNESTDTRHANNEFLMGYETFESFRL